MHDLVRLGDDDEGIAVGEEIHAVLSELLHAMPFHNHCNDCWSACNLDDTKGISNIGHGLPLHSPIDVKIVDLGNDVEQA